MARISTVKMLREAVQSSDADRFSLRDLVRLLHNRAFGLGLFLASMLACLPMPPPIPALGGLIIMFFSIQMMLGHRALKLPGWIGHREIGRERLARGIDRAEPWINRIERLSRTRLTFLTGDIGKFLLGAVALIMGFLLLLPIPVLGNLPPGAAVAIMSLALIQRDGIILLVGYIAAGIAFVLSGGAAWIAVQAFLSFDWQ